MTLTLERILSLPLIGEGNFRRVYRDGANVYKVEYGEGIDLSCNQAEVANFHTLNKARLPDNVDIPYMALTYVDGLPVVRSVFVDGEPYGDCFCLPGEPHLGCMPPGMVRDLNALGLDLAYGNVIRSGDTYWLVDLDADLV